MAKSEVSSEVVMRMNRELNVILKSADFVAKLREVSFEALLGPPEEMKASILRERGLWKKVVETSGATAD
jgi:tripartite-type tricarboxylate transporter receptor subunit TctC